MHLLNSCWDNRVRVHFLPCYGHIRDPVFPISSPSIFISFCTICQWHRYVETVGGFNSLNSLFEVCPEISPALHSKVICLLLLFYFEEIKRQASGTKLFCAEAKGETLCFTYTRKTSFLPSMRTKPINSAWQSF